MNEANWFLKVRFVSDVMHASDMFCRRLALGFHSNRPLGHCPVFTFQDITWTFSRYLLFSYFGCITTDSYYEFFIHHVFVLLNGKGKHQHLLVWVVKQMD